MPAVSEFDWYDPAISYDGEEWDMAWMMGRAAARTLDGGWMQIEDELQAMWRDVASRKSWTEARPAVYAAWRSTRQRIFEKTTRRAGAQWNPSGELTQD